MTAWVHRDEIIDPAAYEAACAQATRDAFASPAGQMLLGMGGDELIDVRVEGSRPDTQIAVVIRYSPEHTERCRTFRYDVWGPPQYHGPSEPHVPSPGLFGVNVMHWTMESGSPPLTEEAKARVEARWRAESGA